MPPIDPVSRAVARLVFRRNSQRIKGYSSYNQIRCTSSISGSPVFSSADRLVSGGYRKSKFLDCENSSNICNVTFQKRGFLGCSDGEAANTLTKVYEERRVMG